MYFYLFFLQKEQVSKIFQKYIIKIYNGEIPNLNFMANLLNWKSGVNILARAQCLKKLISQKMGQWSLLSYSLK